MNIQLLVLLDGPAVLGDPSQWPSQSNCLEATRQTVRELVAQGVMKQVDTEAAASSTPQEVTPKAIETFRLLASGLLEKPV